MRELRYGFGLLFGGLCVATDGGLWAYLGLTMAAIGTLMLLCVIAAPLFLPPPNHWDEEG